VTIGGPQSRRIVIGRRSARVRGVEAEAQHVANALLDPRFLAMDAADQSSVVCFDPELMLPALDDALLRDAVHG
jgi:hypothetical protein